MGYKLNIQHIPQTAYGQNMRSLMTQSEWQKLSSYVRENCVCAGCLQKFAKKYLDAHEVWIFKHGKQKLRRIVPLCKKCHGAVHIGRAAAKGELEEAAMHMMKVRKISYGMFMKEYHETWDKWEQQSRQYFKLVTTKEEAWEIAQDDKEELDAKIAKTNLKASKREKFFQKLFHKSKIDKTEDIVKEENV